MSRPIDASHWPNAAELSYARFQLRDTVLAAGFEPAGFLFYPPPKPELKDYEVLYSGQDGQEFARRMRAGHSTEVFIRGPIAAELDTRYGADQVWLATLFEDGRVLWTNNQPTHTPAIKHHEPDPSDLAELDPQARARLESLLGCMRVESIVGDVEAAMHRPHPWAGLDILVVPELDIDALVTAHLARVQSTPSPPIPASLHTLIAATEWAHRVQSFRERLSVFTGAAVSVLGFGFFAALLWTTLHGTFRLCAALSLGPIALLLALTGFLMWPTRFGIPLAGWVPWPRPRPARREDASSR